jgi:hypothetical protein
MLNGKKESTLPVNWRVYTKKWCACWSNNFKSW